MCLQSGVFVLTHSLQALSVSEDNGQLHHTEWRCILGQMGGAVAYHTLLLHTLQCSIGSIFQKNNRDTNFFHFSSDSAKYDAEMMCITKFIIFRDIISML